ncbi:CDP-alcohol phosphatidyltransferase family protein [Sphingopyxis sp. GW247-27LB]|uniref:CDP-alcohol phosphatidyltransferase family protein n=1 Tax=Sphingopyxis sp. GW247-27LB TaxID=2012632 RepID=UPI000BA6EB35|nr:CDP-alcohol phosphatidyltransferase family protein [Sphingopyxis sp. GW247-27LB]PAL22545.1 CDP-alcohol phosphatidyltransferase [Sphingopyxis sp. GW247-27LB]
MHNNLPSTATTTIQAPTRIQQNILARGERRVLNWLCARLPGWVTPDQLTALGFAGAVLVAAGYMLSWIDDEWLGLSLAGYIVNWFGDSLDGSLARWRHIERPSYGYFVDHSVDGLAIVLIVGGIGASPYFRLDVALLGAIGYLLLAIHTFLSAKVLGEFRLSYMAGGPTELRLMLMAMTMIMPLVGGASVLGTSFSAFDLFGLGVASILVTLFVIQSLATARLLRKRGG